MKVKPHGILWFSSKIILGLITKSCFHRDENRLKKLQNMFITLWNTWLQKNIYDMRYTNEEWQTKVIKWLLSVFIYILKCTWTFLGISLESASCACRALWLPTGGSPVSDTGTGEQFTHIHELVVRDFIDKNSRAHRVSLDILYILLFTVSFYLPY